MKRPYEMTVLLRIMSTPDETQAAVDQLVAWIEGDEENDYGSVRRIDRTTLGRRKLAYEIDGQRDGVYIIIYADIEPAHLPELELNMKLFSPLLRHLIVRDEEEEDKRRDEEMGRNQPEENASVADDAPSDDVEAADSDVQAEDTPAESEQDDAESDEEAASSDDVDNADADDASDA